MHQLTEDVFWNSEPPASIGEVHRVAGRIDGLNHGWVIVAQDDDDADDLDDAEDEDDDEDDEDDDDEEEGDPPGWSD